MYLKRKRHSSKQSRKGHHSFHKTKEDHSCTASILHFFVAKNTSCHRIMMMGLAVFMIHQLRNQSMIDVANRAVDIPVAQESKFAAPQASSDAESAIAALHNELTEYKNDEELEIVYKPKSALRMPEGPKEQNPLQINGNKQQVASAGGNNIEEPYHSDLIQTMQSSPFPNFLEEYAQFHRENKEKPNARYIVWRCPLSIACGGTGDRLKGILSALYTAICTRRILLIHWPLDDGSDFSRFLKPNKMDWKISHKLRPLWMPNSRVFEALDDYNNQWFRELMVPARHEYVPFIDMRCNLWSGWEKGIVHPNKTRCVQDLWANEPPQKNNPHYEQDDFLFRYGFWSMFNFSDKVHERKWNMQRKANILPTETTNFEINPQRRLLEGVYKNQSGLNEAHTKQSKTTDLIETHRQLQSIGSKESEPIAGKTTIQPYIAVHIRTGIGRTWNDPMRHGSNEDLAKFYQCAKRLQKGIQDRQRQVLSQCKQGKNKDEPPPMPIYVAADNVMAKKIMKEMDSAEPKQTVRAIEDMQIYHIDRSVKRGDVIDNELTVWAELNILLEATCIVGSRSGFSDLARWLQPFQNKRCAIQFYQCHDDAEVERALNNVEFVCPKE